MEVCLPSISAEIPGVYPENGTFSNFLAYARQKIVNRLTYCRHSFCEGVWQGSRNIKHMGRLYSCIQPNYRKTHFQDFLNSSNLLTPFDIS